MAERRPAVALPEADIPAPMPGSGAGEGSDRGGNLVVIAAGDGAGRPGGMPGEDNPFLEGVRVQIEEHSVPGEPDHYRRLVVRCPLCTSRHMEVGLPPCAMRRNAGARQTAVHGALETWAFLGAWIRAADGFATRAEHLAFRPSRRVVEEHILSRGWR